MNRHYLPQQPPVWLARAGAVLDAAPLPVLPGPRARTLRLRQLFLEPLGGYASIADVMDAADQEGLLEGLRSAREAVMTALRPVATHNVWESIHAPVWTPHTPVPG